MDARDPRAGARRRRNRRGRGRRFRGRWRGRRRPRQRWPGEARGGNGRRGNGRCGARPRRGRTRLARWRPGLGAGCPVRPGIVRVLGRSAGERLQPLWTKTQPTGAARTLPKPNREGDLRLTPCAFVGPPSGTHWQRLPRVARRRVRAAGWATGERTPGAAEGRGAGGGHPRSGLAAGAGAPVAAGACRNGWSFDRRRLRLRSAVSGRRGAHARPISVRFDAQNTNYARHSASRASRR